MTKVDIDYSNTIIYKITCKDASITDKYVGHTTNFVQRKHAHKQSSQNNKTSNYDTKLYEVIRNNNGWDNWHMEIVNFFNCKDQYEARNKEQEYFILLNATLNSIEPLNSISKKSTRDNTCSVVTTHLSSCKNDSNTSIKTDNDNISRLKYVCESCYYTCSHRRDYNKHLLTNKHINNTSVVPKSRDSYTCEKCSNVYRHKSSLCKHSKTCTMAVDRELLGNVQTNTDITALTNLVMELVKNNNELQKQSQEFQKQLFDMCKNNNQTVINNTTNSNKFNINVFLNEQCKDAINFADFVKSIEVSQTDLHNTGQLGFVDGISKIILDNLKQLSINERPIHCTDIKRETMYIKDEDKWNKEEDDTKLRNAIQTVSRKSMKTLIDWKQVNPDYEDGDSEFSQECLSMQRHSVAGDDREVYYPKVARLVAKEVIIDKL